MTGKITRSLLEKREPEVRTAAISSVQRCFIAVLRPLIRRFLRATLFRIGQRAGLFFKRRVLPGDVNLTLLFHPLPQPVNQAGAHVPVFAVQQDDPRGHTGFQ